MHARPIMISKRTSLIAEGAGRQLTLRDSAAFTLVEMLVVISIMAVLAGLVFMVTPSVTFKKRKLTAIAEMNEIVQAIDSYKAQYNAFPPDNPNLYGGSVSNYAYNSGINTLFYELIGTTYTPGTPDSFTLANPPSNLSSTDVQNAFGVGGFLNVTQGGSDPNSPKAKEFLRPKSSRYAYYPSGGTNVILLICSVEGTNSPPNVLMGNDPQTGTTFPINPWHYVSTTPTNNPKGYELWVDIQSSGSTTNARRSRISNWSKPLDY